MGSNKPSSAREKLSTDAAIWKIIKTHGPIPFKDIKKAVEKDRSTVWRNIALLESEKLIRETEVGSLIYVPFEWSDVKVGVKMALDEFHQGDVSELNWEELENHPKVHKILNTDERSFALHLACSMDPPIKMTSGETKYRHNAAFSYDGGLSRKSQFGG